MKKNIISISISIIIIFIFSINLFALDVPYVPKTARYHSKNINIVRGNINYYWWLWAKNGCGQWTNSNTKVKVTVTSDSDDNPFHDVSSAVSWYGKIDCLEKNSSGQWTRFKVRFNKQSITSDAWEGNEARFTTGVATHELGHAVGLVHPTKPKIESVMAKDRERNHMKYMWPQSKDEYTVNKYIWP